MAYINLYVSDSLFKQVNDIDFEKTTFNNRTDWIKFLIRIELPNMPKKLKEATK